MASRTEQMYAPGCVRQLDRLDALRHVGSCAGRARDGAA
jgi:hypothetical protein